MPLLKDDDFKVGLDGILINNHYIAESEKFNVGFLDSGTTFTYFPKSLFQIIKLHFAWFCDQDPENNCKGAFMKWHKDHVLCFEYIEEHWPLGPLTFFKSFPVLRFRMKTSSATSDTYSYNWYPSEYLYRDKANMYCLAADTQSGNEIMMGGTFLRQHNLLFETSRRRVGIAHATCAEDPNQILVEAEMIEAG